MSRRCDVVREAQAIVVVFEVHVQQTLICTVEGDAPFRHGHHGVVITHVWGQGHDSSVEKVGPTNVRSSGEVMLQIEELIHGPAGDHVGIEIDDLPILGLFPQVDLGEGRMQIGSVHQVEVCWLCVADPGDRYHVVENSLGASRSILLLQIKT